jgi:hypothetical protein
MDGREIMFDIQRRYAVDWDGQAPIQQDIDLWTGGSEEAEPALYNRIAEELALGYSEKRYSFEFCDAVVNQLWGLLIDKQPLGTFPELFRRVYDAFDAGEYYRTADASDEPIISFTDPAIAEIVRSL